MTTLLRRSLLLWDAADHDAKPYTATFIYRVCDPFAVRLLVPDHGTNKVAEVVFARVLLIDGFTAPTGDGAVRVEPHIVDRDYMTLTLPTTRDGKEFYTERRPLQEFVIDTCAVVPSGSERPRVNAELDRWLAEATL
ncbi:SsgA family sporulation/cell division regulator [Nonomuraea sp. CA-143628]|uniref:SsgA family sporulation/cell division regulator n=1 Tax=Nonomuraea sp. CA-143628 TaxID=3239997 RepID=UPI003D8D51F5